MPRLNSLLLLTLRQLFTPWTGGWRSIADDYQRVLSQLCSPDGVFMESTLLGRGVLANAPVALVRSPVNLALAAVAGLAFALLGWPDEAVRLELLEDLPAVVFQAVGLSLLQGLLLGRAILVALIEERDSVLADNIRRACVRASASGSGGREVVAVLGAAHINGVLRTLLSSGMSAQGAAVDPKDPDLLAREQ